MGYCKYIFKKGNRRGETCKEVCHLESTTCKKHKSTDNIPIIRINDFVSKKITDDYLKEVILNIPTSDTNKAVILKHYNNKEIYDILNKLLNNINTIFDYSTNKYNDYYIKDNINDIFQVTNKFEFFYRYFRWFNL